MLTLYSQETCPFCRRVLAVLDRIDVEVDIRDLADDPAYTDELKELGGKKQVPFLVDEEKGVSMYESDDIVKYLQDTYGTPSKPRVHMAGGESVCIACEG